MKTALLLTALLASGIAFAANETAKAQTVINPPAEGSVTPEQGLQAWQRIYEVISHPRCANCHVGPDNRPMWSGPSYGKSRPHGMNINGGEAASELNTFPAPPAIQRKIRISPMVHQEILYGIWLPSKCSGLARPLLKSATS